MLQKLYKEPLLHFLLIGAALFLLHDWRNGAAPLPPPRTEQQSTEIVVAREDIALLEDTYTKTWRRPPNAKERQGLVDSFVRDEIYYREARAMGLDRQDTVIKRRMRQQMEFIFEDITTQVEPRDDELHAFMQENSGRYQLDPQLAFSHIYLGEYQTAELGDEKAQSIRGRLVAGADPETLGEPFLQGSDMPLSPLWSITRMFGEKFADRLVELPLDVWHGPLRSPYGLHLVRVSERRERRLPPLTEVREKVKRDLTGERQQKLKDEAYATLRQKYSVIIEKPQDVAAGELEKQQMSTVN